MGFWALALLLLLALFAAFLNGLRDAAPAMDTVVSTGVLSPMQAVLFAAFFNLAAILVFQFEVAALVATGLVDPGAVDRHVLVGTLAGCIGWGLMTWRLALPASSSHALVGALLGATLAQAGPGALLGAGIGLTLAFLLLAPLLALGLAGGLMLALAWLLRRRSPMRIDNAFRRVQLVSAALYSLGHGGSDAQKSVGLVWLLLLAAGSASVADGRPPAWVAWACYLALAVGTLVGGWRIVNGMGPRFSRLRPVDASCAEAGAAATLFITASAGIAVSTTHVHAAAIAGSRALGHAAALRRVLAPRAIATWALTLPGSALLAAACSGLSRLLH